VKRELIIDSLYQNHKISVDLTYNEEASKLQPIIFTHNFKSFKDWGTFNLIAEQAASQGFLFIKYNCSHDGTSPEKPTEFSDLEAFKNNNISIELNDLKAVIDYLYNGQFGVDNLQLDSLCLVGHGRGGNVALIKASEDARVSKVASWNASSKILDFSSSFMENWKNDGLIEFWNVRIKRHMPVGYQFVEDYNANEDRFDTEKVMKRLDKPVLIIHGEEDTRVKLESAYYLKRLSEKAELVVIDKADHNFCAYHPYLYDYLNSETRQVCTATLKFFTR